MGFADSFVTWMILTIVIAFLIFAVFSFILGWFYHKEEEIEITQEELDEYQKKSKSKSRLIGLFIISAIIAIMGTTGITAYMNTKS